ncbi:MAG TPA: gingipain R, partial [Thermoplasmatales archaeon]|nr:gingipain R [Thermoplasmatales archaeon]
MWRKNLLGKGLVLIVVMLLIGTIGLPTGYRTDVAEVSADINGLMVASDSYGDGDYVTVSAWNDAEITKLTCHINGFNMEPVWIDGEKYFRVTMGREPNILHKGCPDVPVICRSIVIPDDVKMETRITYIDYQDYEDVMIAPSKGVVLRTVDPLDIPYEFGEIYQKNAWFPEKLVVLREPYILRDLRGQVVEINPVQYNPVTKQLRVYTDIIVEVYPAAPGEINVYERTKPLTKIDRDFRSIYERHFLNFDSIHFNGLDRDPYNPVDEQGNMLVICYDDFYDAMQPLVTWKNMKGIPTEMVKISEVGSNSDDIYNYIVDYYNTKGLTFVLLVGDAAQIPPRYVGSVASDTSYSYVVGNDHYPDLFVGRFSAENTAHVETQVERTINYEKYPQAGADWYHKGVGIASSQGPGDDGEYDYQHVRNIRSDLFGYTYTYVDELYDGSQGGDDEPGNPTPSMVSDALNNGRSIINYCGHGSTTSWGTSGFSNTDVNALTNDNMLPFIFSVACLNGNFVS